MGFLDLPPELFVPLIEIILVCNGPNVVGTLRRVCKLINDQVLRSLYETQVSEVLDLKPAFPQQTIVEWIDPERESGLRRPLGGTHMAIQENLIAFRHTIPTEYAVHNQVHSEPLVESVVKIMQSIFHLRPALQTQKDTLLLQLSSTLFEAHPNRRPEWYFKGTFCICHSECRSEQSDDWAENQDRRTVFGGHYHYQTLQFAASLGIIDLITEIDGDRPSDDLLRPCSRLRNFTSMPCTFSCALIYRQPEVLAHLVATLFDRSVRWRSDEKNQRDIECALGIAASLDNSDAVFLILKKLFKGPGPEWIKQLENSWYPFELALMGAARGGSLKLIKNLLKWRKLREERKWPSSQYCCSLDHQCRSEVEEWDADWICELSLLKRMILGKRMMNGELMVSMLLLEASWAGNLPLINLLLESYFANADLDKSVPCFPSRGLANCTPLLAACYGGSTEAMEILINNGATTLIPPSFRDERRSHYNKFSSFTRRARYNKISITRRNRPTDDLREGRSKWSDRLLVLAVETGSIKVVSVLIKHGLKPKKYPEVLPAAYARYDWDMMIFLLKNGASLKQHEVLWQAELRKAISNNDLRMIERLNNFGVKLRPDYALLAELACGQLCEESERPRWRW